MAPAPNAATPLVDASPRVSSETAEPAAWAGISSAMRDAAWRFAATCTLGAGAACTLARYYHDRGPLVVGLPLTAVTALGVTSWRLSREQAPRDLEQGLSIAASPPGAVARADWTTPAGADVVWIAAPVEALSRVYGATQPTPIDASKQARPYAHARPRHVARFGAGRLRPQVLSKHQHKARADARKRSAAGRLQSRPELTLRPSTFALSAVATPPAAATTTPCVSAASLAPSEHTLYDAAAQPTPKAPKQAACVFSQSLPNQPWPKLIDTSSSVAKLAQSDLAPLSSRAQVATDVAMQLAQTKALAQALENLSISGTKAWMREAEDDGLIMPKPRQDTAMSLIIADSDRSSLSAFTDVSCATSPEPNTTPLPSSPPSD